MFKRHRTSTRTGDLKITTNNLPLSFFSLLSLFLSFRTDFESHISKLSSESAVIKNIVYIKNNFEKIKREGSGPVLMT